MDALQVNLAQSHRLVTHEDTFHIHKSLGLLCLINFGYRLYSLLTTGSSGYEEYSTLNVTTLCIHASLHFSSFIFALSNKRNKTYNIIWPEARWHSMVFAYRSIIMILIHYYVTDCSYFIRCGVIILTMACADIVSRSVPSGTMTMRDNPYPKYVSPQMANVFNTVYAVSQLFATLNILVRDNDQIFWMLLPIQLSPFLMTLQKKGIINQAGWHLYYIVALAVNYAYYINVPDIQPPVSRIVAILAILRFRFRINKYLLWSSIFFVYAGRVSLGC
jgi:hypothetical protein